MINETVNAVGIDISKGKNTIAVMRPLGEIVISPFELSHSSSDLKLLASTLRKLDGDTKIIMEYTGKYYQPIAKFLYSIIWMYTNATHFHIILQFPLQLSHKAFLF